MAVFSADKNVNVISMDLLNNMSMDSYLLCLQNDTKTKTAFQTIKDCRKC